MIRDSFVRAFDDAIVLKGLNWGRGDFHERPVRNVRVHDNVIWCDWGRALEIGAETSAPEIAEVRFRDCDIVRTTHIAMDIQCGDRALVQDIRYENIRVEIDDVCPAPRMQGSREDRYLEEPSGAYVPNLLVIVIGTLVIEAARQQMGIPAVRVHHPDGRHAGGRGAASERPPPLSIPNQAIVIV